MQRSKSTAWLGAKGGAKALGVMSRQTGAPYPMASPMVHAAPRANSAYVRRTNYVVKLAMAATAYRLPFACRNYIGDNRQCHSYLTPFFLFPPFSLIH
jgi:hypothetical protein